MRPVGAIATYWGPTPMTALSRRILTTERESRLAAMRGFWKPHR